MTRTSTRQPDLDRKTRATTTRPTCTWAQCDVDGTCSHETDTRWVNSGDRRAGEVHGHAADDGLVTISEAALAQLLIDAGWERSR